MPTHATAARRLRITTGVRTELLPRLSLTGTAGMRTWFRVSLSWHLVPFLSLSVVTVGLHPLYVLDFTTNGD
jgi:hypothetical protein